MVKYNTTFKLQAVEAYLAGKSGYRAIAEIFGVKCHANLSKWV